LPDTDIAIMGELRENVDALLRIFKPLGDP
jgi:hypothetical protein